MSRSNYATCAGIGSEGERRRAQRYVLCLPVLFHWQESSGPEHKGGGFTRDVSARGMYVTSESECPPAGSAATIVVLLPSFDSELVGLKLKASGTVVRIAGPTESVGFAVAADLDDSLMRQQTRDK